MPRGGRGVTHTLTVRRLAPGTLFRLLMLGAVVFHVASSLIVLLLVAAGVLPFDAAADEVPLSTLLLIVAAYLVAGVIFTPLWAGVLWLAVWPGLWLYSMVRTIDIRYTLPD